MAGLGRGFAETGKLNPKGRERALQALGRFAMLGEAMGVSPLTAVATAAVREASDGPDFVETVKRETGIDLWVIDGEEEARLSAQGVLLGWPDAEGLICDIGGSSMELAEVSGGKVGRRITSPLGPFRLAEIDPKKLDRHIAGAVAGLRDEMGDEPECLYLVGGSWRAIARLDMVRQNYPLTVLHEYRMTREDVAETVEWILDNDITALRKRADLSEARMALVPTACRVLRHVVETLRPRRLAVSSYGIREGLLYEQMPQEIRDRDPLIEASRFAEKKDARMPGFGRKLYTFVKPLFPDADYPLLRIVRAACLLHDVSWRAHPDYRHEVCFDNATRANLGGLTHPERVFLGLALLHRYKGSRSGSQFDDLVSLLDAEEIKRAEVLGRAMRLGAMLTVDDPASMGELRWFPAKARLEMHVSTQADALFGEVAESRFRALASALDAESEVIRAAA